MVDKNPEVTPDEFKKVRGFQKISGINKDIHNDITFSENDETPREERISELTIKLRKATKKYIAEDTLDMSES